MQGIFRLVLFLALAKATVLYGKEDLVPVYQYRGSDLILNGPWLFFPEIFLSPATPSDWKSIPHRLVDLPNDLPTTDRNPELPAWGTLVIRLQDLDRSNEDMGLKLRANSAYQVYLYNPGTGLAFKPVLSVGTPAARAEESLPENVDRLGVIRHSDISSDFLLIVHISGWYFHSSCIWGIPRILPLSEAARSEDWTRFIEALALGTLLTMALYFFSFAMRRKEDTSAFWLAMLAVFAAIRLIVTSGSLLNFAMLSPSVMTHAIIRKLEFGAIPALGFTGLAFVIQCFGAIRLNRFVKYDGIAAASLYLLCLLTPTTHLNRFLHLLNGYVLLHFFVGMYVCLSSIKTHTSATIALIVGLTINLLAAIHDVAVGSGVSWTTGYFLSPFGVAAFIFSQGQILSINFDKAYRLAARLSKDLSREVERQTAEVKTIMNSIPQGVLIITSSGHIAPGISPQVKRILKRESIEGEPWFSVLFADTNLSDDQRQIARETMKIVLDEHLMNFDVNRGNLPNELKLNRGTGMGTYLELTWSPLLNKKNTVEAVLVTIFDATQKKLDEMEAQKNEYEMQLIREIVAIPLDRYHPFRDSSESMLAEMEYFIMLPESLDSEIIRKIYLNAHTLKGTSRTMGLQYLANSLHDIETALDALRRDGASNDSYTNLKDKYRKVAEVFGDYQNVNDHVLGRVRQDTASISVPKSTLEQCSSYLLHVEGYIGDQALKKELTQLSHELVKLTHVSLQDLLEDAVQDLNKIALDLSKPCPDITIQGERVYLNKQAADALKKALVHLLRNSMDHGIEDVSDRITKGKSPKGHMEFRWSMDDASLSVVIADDGKGLAVQDIMEKGLERGILSLEESTDLDKVVNLIFHPNFSTAQRVTQYSGRGIGMNAVRSYIEAIGGNVIAKLVNAKASHGHMPFFVQITIPAECCSNLFGNPSQNHTHAPKQAI